MVESSALLKRRSPKGYRGFESLPHRFSLERCNQGICDCTTSMSDAVLVKLLQTEWAKQRQFRLTSKSRANWRECVIEYIIAHPPPQRDAFRFIEGPMDAQINPALAILFLSLG